MISLGILVWTWLRTLWSGRGQPLVSHTAAIVVMEGRPWVIESTSMSVKADAMDLRHAAEVAYRGRVYPRSGVQAHRLDDWLDNYPGRIWHVRLARDLPRPNEYAAYLWHKHTQQTGYDRIGAAASASWLVRWFQWLIRGWRRIRNHAVPDSETGRPIYCTALYLYALKRGGIFPPPDITPRRHYPRSALALDFVGRPYLIK